MTGSKRQRELARAKYERQQERRRTRGDRRRRVQRIVAVAVVAALVVGGLVWAAASLWPGRTTADDAIPAPASSLASAVASAVAASAVSASPTPTTSPTPTGSSPSAAPSADTGPASTAEPIEEPAILDCSPPGVTRADNVSFTQPDASTDATRLTLTTNCGDIVIALDPQAPSTIASEAFLASKGFYDNTACHRLTTQGIYVLQCGDPAGDGTGGPGYSVPDENLPSDGAANYPAGTVAMANAGPGTSGSQFFVVYQDTTLPGDYTIWGKVTSGLDIVQEVASVGTADGGPDGTPRQPVFIESASVQ